MNNEMLHKEASWFNYFYMLVMVIYMGQATRETACMTGGSLVKQFIPIFIPIFLTLVLLYKNKKISYKSKNLRLVCIIFVIWCVAVSFKYSFSISNNEAISKLFFLFYALILAYIHTNIFGKSFFSLYEKIIVYISALSIIFWMFSIMMPSLSASFFRQFPEANMSTYGNTFLYLFTWMDPVKGQVFGNLNRNAGCAWEPGRFAIMLCLAILINLLRNGIKFHNNKSIWVLLIALATTFSTTGYCITIIMYALFGISIKSSMSLIAMLFIFIPSVFFISTFDFIGAKLDDQTDFRTVLPELEARMNIAEQTMDDGEYAFSLERFPAMYFESMNVINDPILGYTQMKQYSYFHNNISSHCILTGGIVKLFGWFGIFIGAFLYWILYESSKYIAYSYGWKKQQVVAIFLCIVLSSISYVIYSVPIFTTIWFYGYFTKRKQMNYFETRQI